MLDLDNDLQWSAIPPSHFEQALSNAKIPPQDLQSYIDFLDEIEAFQSAEKSPAVYTDEFEL
jgi:hypothetical protein